MKAKLKDGRILPIEKNSLIALDNNGDTLEVSINDIECFVESNSIDLKKIRINAAIAAMQGLLSNPCCGYDQEFISELSVRCSDRLVKEISKEMKKWR